MDSQFSLINAAMEKMNKSQFSSANLKRCLESHLNQGSHLVTAAYSFVCLTTKPSDANRWEFYSEHQPINQPSRLLFFTPMP